MIGAALLLSVSITNASERNICMDDQTCRAVFLVGAAAGLVKAAVHLPPDVAGKQSEAICLAVGGLDTRVSDLRDFTPEEASTEKFKSQIQDGVARAKAYCGTIESSAVIPAQNDAEVFEIASEIQDQVIEYLTAYHNN